MKKLYTLFLSFSLLAIGQLSAQQVTISPSDSVHSDISTNSTFTTFDQYIYLHNTHSDSIQIVWRLLSHTDPGWSLQLCDNSACYQLPTPPKTSLKFGPGDSLDMHALIAPQLIAGSGSMRVGVRIAGGTEAELTIVYHSTVTVTSGIEDLNGESVAISVFPNPATDEITISGMTTVHAVTIQVLDVQGKLLNENTTEKTSFTENVSALPAGVYFVKVLDDNNRLSVVKKFSKF